MIKKIINFSAGERLIIGILMGIISPLIPLIASDLKVGLDYLGTAVSLSTVGMFLAALFLGNLIDILGFRIIISIGIIISLLGGIGLFFSHSYPFFIISYFILNLGLVILELSTLSLVGYFSSENKLKNLIKISIMMCAGSVIAPLLISLILTLKISWRYLYLYLIAAQIVAAIILFFLKIPKKIKTHNNLKIFLQNNKLIFRKPFFLLYCFSLLVYTSLITTFSTWFTTYFTGLSVELKFSSLFLASYMVAILLGMVLKNYLINYMKERMMLVISLLLSLIFFIFIFFINILVVKIIFILLFGVTIAGIFTLIYSLILEIGGEYINIASGIIFSFNYFGIIIFQFLIGYLSEYYSKKSILYVDISLLSLLFIFSLIIYFKSKSGSKAG